MESNEPKNRVSQGNEAFNPISGLAWGVGIGAVGSGTYMGQAYMSYKNFPKRIEKIKQKAASELEKADEYYQDSPNYNKHMKKHDKLINKKVLTKDQSNHRYVKLGGGWKKTGIIAASAAAGGLIGSASGYVNENWVGE